MAERDNNQSKEAKSNTDKFLAMPPIIGRDSEGNFLEQFHFIVTKY